MVKPLVTDNKDKARSQESKIKISDLFYYFDSQERTRLDQGAIGRRSGQVLALRERLLKLPEIEFDTTMRSIEAIVKSQGTESPSRDEQSQQNRLRRKDAIELFEKASQSTSLAKAESVSKI